MSPKGLHGKIRSLLRMRGEIIYGDTHIINISEEEEIDHFSEVVYRVYSNEGFVFDVIQEYSSEAEDGGGGLVYQLLPHIWDGFESIKPVTIEKAYEIVNKVLNNREKIYRHESHRYGLLMGVSSREQSPEECDATDD